MSQEQTPVWLSTVDLAADLKRDEGERLKVYKCPAGRWTIGYGRNVEDVGISKAEAEFLLSNDIARVVKELDRHVPWWRNLSHDRQRALGNMCFQMGLPRFQGFTGMLSALKAGDYRLARQEALDSLWARQVPERAHRIADLIWNEGE